MVIAGKKCARQASVQEVAEATIRCLKRYVPAAVRELYFSPRAKRRGCNRPSERHERNGRASVAGQLLVWASATGTGAGGWQDKKQCRCCAEGAPDPLPSEWPGARR